MIVIEGPDGAGKSTLVRHLSDTLGLPVAAKVVSSQTHILCDLKQWVEENVTKGFQATLFDRHRLISGPIYNAVLGRSDPAFYNPEWMGLMVKRFYLSNPLIVYCLPPFITVERNVSEGEADNEAVKNVIQPLYDLYVARSALDIESGRGFIFDYTQHHSSLVVSNVMAHLEGAYV